MRNEKLRASECAEVNTDRNSTCVEGSVATEPGQIEEAVVLSPSTSMTVLSRAVSGEGTADSTDNCDCTEGDNSVGVDTSLKCERNQEDDAQLGKSNSESSPRPDDEEHMFGYRKVPHE